MSDFFNKDQYLPFLFIDACLKKDLRKVEACLLLGVNPNTVSEDGKWSGLSVASFENEPQLLDLMLKQPDIDINLPTSATIHRSNWAHFGKHTPLMIATLKGNHEIVKKILQVPNVNFYFKDSNSAYVLHFAAIRDCVKIFSEIDGLDWNRKCNDNSTPLQLAIKFGHLTSVKAILSLPNIDLKSRNGEGDTVALTAVKSEKREHLNCMKIMLKTEGIDWNVVDKKGDTPIMWSAKNQKMDKLGLLAQCHRVDLNLKDKSGDTVALWALKNNKFDIVKLLAKQTRLNVTACDKDGNTLTKIARNKDLQEILEILPGTTEYKLKELQDAMSRHMKIPECPICLSYFKTNGRIFQCNNGHLICENCKDSLVKKVCPTCQLRIDGRAHGMEDFLRN